MSRISPSRLCSLHVFIRNQGNEDHVDTRSPRSHHVPCSTSDMRKKTHKRNMATKQSGPAIFTSQAGHFELQGPCLIRGRYNVIKILDSTGQSAVLVLAEDLVSARKLVVIKILHSHLYQIGVQESHVLMELASLDPMNISHTLRLMTTVVYGSHYCLVLEPLLPDPLTTVFAKLPQDQLLGSIRKVGLRLLACVGFLHHHNLIHTDLKPENLLLKDETDLDSVHIVDFGSAVHYVKSEVALYYQDFQLQTPLYRAPEVLFGMGFGMEIDMWSLGCVLAELYLGDPLFLGDSVVEIMGKVRDIFGPFPRRLFRKAKYYNKYEEFTQDEEPSNGTLQLMEVLQCDDILFADLLTGLLKYDPEERFTASEAACHPFFASYFPIAYLMPDYKGKMNVSNGGLCPESPVTSPSTSDIKRRQPMPCTSNKMTELAAMNKTFVLNQIKKSPSLKQSPVIEEQNYDTENSMTDNSQDTDENGDESEEEPTDLKEELSFLDNVRVNSPSNQSGVSKTCRRTIGFRENQNSKCVAERISQSRQNLYDHRCQAVDNTFRNNHKCDRMDRQSWAIMEEVKRRTEDKRKTVKPGVSKHVTADTGWIDTHPGNDSQDELDYDSMERQNQALMQETNRKTEGKHKAAKPGVSKRLTDDPGWIDTQSGNDSRDEQEDDMIERQIQFIMQKIKRRSEDKHKIAKRGVSKHATAEQPRVSKQVTSKQPVVSKHVAAGPGWIDTHSGNDSYDEQEYDIMERKNQAIMQEIKRRAEDKQKATKPGASKHLTAEPGVSKYVTAEQPGVSKRVTDGPPGVSKNVTAEQPGVSKRVTAEHPGVSKRVATGPAVTRLLTRGLKSKQSRNDSKGEYDYDRHSEENASHERPSQGRHWHQDGESDSQFKLDTVKFKQIATSNTNLAIGRRVYSEHDESLPVQSHINSKRHKFAINHDGAEFSKDRDSSEEMPTHDSGGKGRKRSGYNDPLILESKRTATECRDLSSGDEESVELMSPVYQARLNKTSQVRRNGNTQPLYNNHRESASKVSKTKVASPGYGLKEKGQKKWLRTDPYDFLNTSENYSPLQRKPNQHSLDVFRVKHAVSLEQVSGQRRDNGSKIEIMNHVQTQSGASKRSYSDPSKYYSKRKLFKLQDDVLGD